MDEIDTMNGMGTSAATGAGVSIGEQTSAPKVEGSKETRDKQQTPGREGLASLFGKKGIIK